jgi:para-nitrobenzyl esterase
MNKITVLLACAAVTLALPAIAQNAPATAAPPAPAAAATYSTAETTIGDLRADPAARAIVEKHLPGLLDADGMDMAVGMTLRVIQPMAGDKIPEKALDDIDADLAKLSAKKG